MTTGCGRCRRHPGSKKRPWNVEPASADALRPGPPARLAPPRLAKASLRKMRPATVRLEVTGCIAWAGWPDRLWPGALRADAAGGCAAGGCADCWGCRPGRSPNAGWARDGPPRPPTRFSGVGATTVRSFGPCPAGPCRAAAAGAGAIRCAGGVAARGACGAPRGAAMCGAAGRAAGAACGAGAARGAAAGCGAGAGCPAGGAPGGFAVAEVAAMPAARTRSAALRMRDCNMIPAPASSFRVNVGTGWWLRVRRCRGSIASGQCDDHTFRIAACENEQIDMGLFQAGSRIWTASRLRSDSGISIKKLRGLPHPSRRMLRTFSECGRREFHRIISVPAPWSVRSSSSTACGTLPSRITTPSTPASSA